jgi:hypothetical protein
MEEHHAGTNEGQGKPSIATKRGFHGTDTSWGVTAVTELFFAPCEVERMSEVEGMVDELADRHRRPAKNQLGAIHHEGAHREHSSVVFTLRHVLRRVRCRTVGERRPNGRVAGGVATTRGASFILGRATQLTRLSWSLAVFGVPIRYDGTGLVTEPSRGSIACHPKRSPNLGTAARETTRTMMQSMCIGGEAPRQRTHSYARLASLHRLV